MTTRFRLWVVGVCTLLLPGVARAQVIDLGASGADEIWVGTESQAAAGAWLDQGAVSASDSRRDLIIGAPGAAGVPGHVYVIFGGRVRSGTLSLSGADAVLTGANPGDRFGSSTAAGNIWNLEGSIPRALVVGAPNSGAGDAGAVYLFRGGFTLAASLTAANALLEIRGKPGDRLGSSLATADVNNDGYRDIVIGAPGNNRVYVVYGGAALDHAAPATVIDLATTPAGLTITAPGIGGVLSAGDITGDGIYDIVMGAPTANRVYAIKGRTSASFPASWDLGVTPADITLFGASSGDDTGAALRIADLDADNQRDLFIGAPRGDGPSGRSDCGEVYVMFGSTLAALAASAPATLNVALADVRFYGEHAGDKLGTALTAGDINRDIPDDVVVSAPGSSAGGAWLVYYGRPRSAIGTPDASGVRIVDFAAGGVDRWIVGDPARGSVTSGQVFEVTGEGARDIIVGVPASDAGAGAVFFTISPKLQLSDKNLSVSLVVNAGQSFSAPVRVKNASTLSITWVASGNRAWITTGPSAGSAVVTQDGLFYIILSAAGMAPGTYTGTVTVKSTSRDLEMSLPIAVTMLVAPAVRDPDDFTGDGTLDLIWQHQVQGWLAVWRMNGTTMMSGDPITPGQVADTDWKIVGTGDFNGDGHADLLWQHQTQGWVSVWLMNGTTQLRAESLTPDRVADTNWKIVATGDFNGDGKRDILWQHQTERWVAVWLMNGTAVIDAHLLSPSQVADANWKIVGAGDFNGDGKTDIAWQNQANGYLSVWYMNGSQLIDGVWVSPNQVADTDWKVVGVGDISGDGKPDLIWQHSTSGAIATWIMNGVTSMSATLLSPGSVSDLAWRIVGPR